MLAAIRGGPCGGDKLAATTAQLHTFKARSDMLAKQVLSIARSANAGPGKSGLTMPSTGGPKLHASS
eukprot:2795364-Pyramimonas_sp.AAC.1